MDGRVPSVGLRTLAKPEALEVDGYLVGSNEKVSASIMWAAWDFLRKLDWNVQRDKVVNQLLEQSLVAEITFRVLDPGRNVSWNFQ